MATYRHWSIDKLDALLDTGLPISQLSMENGIGEMTFYRRRRQREESKKAAKHIPDSSNKYLTPKPKHSTVLVIPDLHCPFEHLDSLEFLKAVKRRHHPDAFVCLGDEADFAAFSKYPKDSDGLSAGQELQKAREHLIPFYLEFPEMMICTSNHTVRPLKQMFLAGLPEAMYPTYSMLLNAPDGWIWKDHWEIDNVMYIHGEGRSGANAHTQFLKAYKQSVVIGHIHSYAAVSYEGRHFAMNTGCLIDQKAYAFKYAKSMPIKVNLGCGLVVDGKHAYFIPMLLNDEGRWIGHL